MAKRPSLDVELRPLLRALENRIGNLDGVRKTRCDGYDAFSRDGVPFLHLEIRRDHMHLDLWLGEEILEEARSSGIARPHPFLGEQAVRVRFERAEDLTRVAQWLEASHRGAPGRAESEEAVPPSPSAPEGSRVGGASNGNAGAAARSRSRPSRSNAEDGQKRAARKVSARRKPSSR